jgi:hypothetical protein
LKGSFLKLPSVPCKRIVCTRICRVSDEVILVYGSGHPKESRRWTAATE